MLEELTKHITNNNCGLVKRLADIIVNNKVETLEELDNLYHFIDDKLEFAKKTYKYCDEDYETMDYDQIQEYKVYREILYNDNSSEDEVIKAIIMLGYLADRELLFLKELYMLIIEDKI